VIDDGAGVVVTGAHGGEGPQEDGDGCERLVASHGRPSRQVVVLYLPQCHGDGGRGSAGLAQRHGVHDLVSRAASQFPLQSHLQIMQIYADITDGRCTGVRE
jgi:hypothetical protein